MRPCCYAWLLPNFWRVICGRNTPLPSRLSCMEQYIYTFIMSQKMSHGIEPKIPSYTPLLLRIEYTKHLLCLLERVWTLGLNQNFHRITHIKEWLINSPSTFYNDRNPNLTSKYNLNPFWQWIDQFKDLQEISNNVLACDLEGYH